MLEGKKICFIGAGSMAQAMIWGLLSSNLIKPESIYVTNKSDRAKLNKLGEKWGVNITYDKALMLQMADIIILAVKPKDVREVLKTIKAHVTRTHLILSVVAGIGTDLIQTLVGKEVPIIRAMPCFYAGINHRFNHQVNIGRATSTEAGNSIQSRFFYNYNLTYGRNGSGCCYRPQWKWPRPHSIT